MNPPIEYSIDETNALKHPIISIIKTSLTIIILGQARFFIKALQFISIFAKEIPRIDLIFHIFQVCSPVSVRQDHRTSAFEFVKVVHDRAAEKCRSRKHRLVNDNLGAFGFDSFHHTLYRTVSEIVAPLLHDQPIDADDGGPFPGSVVFLCRPVVVKACPFKRLIGNEFLARPIRLDDGFDQILRDIPIIRQKLLRVLWQTVPAVPERGIMIVPSDARVERDALNDSFTGKAFADRVSIELIEIGNTHGKVGVGEQLDRFGLRRAHDKNWHVFFQRRIFEQRSESLRCRLELRHAQAHDNPRRVEIVIERVALPQELRTEKNMKPFIAFAYTFRVANRNRAFNNDAAPGMNLANHVQNLLDEVGVEIIRFAVIVRRNGDDNELRRPIGFRRVRRSQKAQIFRRQVFLNLRVFDRGFFSFTNRTFSATTSTAITSCCCAKSTERERPTYPRPAMVIFMIEAAFLY